MEPEHLENAMPGLVKKSGWVRSPVPRAQVPTAKGRGAPRRTLWFWMVPGLVAAGLLVAIVPRPSGTGMPPGEEPSESQSLPPSAEHCTASPAVRPVRPSTPVVPTPRKADPASPRPERRQPC